MSQTGAVVVACRVEENLSFLLKAHKGVAVDNAVTVTLKIGAQRALGLFSVATLRVA